MAQFIVGFIIFIIVIVSTISVCIYKAAKDIQSRKKRKSISGNDCFCLCMGLVFRADEIWRVWIYVYGSSCHSSWVWFDSL